MATVAELLGAAGLDKLARLRIDLGQHQDPEPAPETTAAPPVPAVVFREPA